MAEKHDTIDYYALVARDEDGNFWVKSSNIEGFAAWGRSPMELHERGYSLAKTLLTRLGAFPPKKGQRIILGFDYGQGVSPDITRMAMEFENVTPNT